MARINTNVGAVTAQRYLAGNQASLTSTIERLASGLRITRGADDPAGLIASERLRAEISAVGQAISNSERASNIVATTEGALNEVASLLNDIQQLVVEAANEGGMSEEEIEANQLQVDSAIASITRIANSTSFAGRQLLNGSLDYVTSGVDDSVVNALDIQGVQFGTRDSIPVNIDVTTSAQPGRLAFPAGTITSSVTIELQGALGATTIPFTSGESAADMVDAINLVSDATGVTATLSSDPAQGFVLESADIGSRNFVSITTLPGGGDFLTYDEAGTPTPRDEGRDAVAMINGAMCFGDGNKLTLKTLSLIHI